MWHSEVWSEYLFSGTLLGYVWWLGWLACLAVRWTQTGPWPLSHSSWPMMLGENNHEQKGRNQSGFSHGTFWVVFCCCFLLIIQFSCLFLGWLVDIYQKTGGKIWAGKWEASFILRTELTRGLCPRSGVCTCRTARSFRTQLRPFREWREMLSRTLSVMHSNLGEVLFWAGFLRSTSLFDVGFWFLSMLYEALVFLSGFCSGFFFSGRLPSKIMTITKRRVAWPQWVKLWSVAWSCQCRFGMIMPPTWHGLMHNSLLEKTQTRGRGFKNGVQFFGVQFFWFKIID